MKKFINKFRQKEKEGFTIIETLVAITILMIAIVGPLTIAQRSLSASIYARDQVIATYLAQDAMEQVKNIVADSPVPGTLLFGIDGVDEFHEGEEQDGGWAEFCNKGNKCAVDTYLGGFVNSDIQNETYFELHMPDSQVGMYIPNPQAKPTGSIEGTPLTYQKTIFKRMFYIDTTNVSDFNREATLVVSVVWNSGGLNHEVRLHSQVFTDVKL